MAESFVQVNQAATPGKKLATYEYENESGDKVASEAVTLTTGEGRELLGLQSPNHSVPVVVADQPEKLHNGREHAIGDTPVRVLHANSRRLTALVQNTGSANIRVGVHGVTATTGLRLVPNAVEIFTVPDVYKGEVWAIREGAVDSIAFAQETTATIHRHHEHDESGEHHVHEDGEGEHESAAPRDQGDLTS
jgi:hypothetical protein